MNPRDLPEPPRLTVVLLVLVLLLAVPPLARADNCFGEGGECARRAFWSNVAMVGAALALIGAALWGPRPAAEPPPPAEDTGARIFRRYKEAAEARDRGDPGSDVPYENARRELQDWNEQQDYPDKWRKAQEQASRERRDR